MSLRKDESVSTFDEALQTSHFRIDLITSYALAGTRVFAWIIVSGLIYRLYGPVIFVLLTVVRATMAPLTFVAISIGPSTIRTLSSWKQKEETEPATLALPARDLPPVLNYAHGRYDPVPKILSPWSPGVSSLLLLTISLFIAGSIVTVLLAHFALRLPSHLSINPSSEFRVIDNFFYCAVSIGFGLILRSLSDGLGAVLHVQNRLALDNVLCIGAELLFLAICSALLMASSTSTSEAILRVGAIYGLSGALLMVARTLVVNFDPATSLSIQLCRPDFALSAKLIWTGLLLTLAQLADLMYAPFAIQIANRLFEPAVIASYSIALMVDSALLLLVAGISAPLLPRLSKAHVIGRLDLVRKYYVRASIVALAILVTASVSIWASWSFIVKLWLDDAPPSLSTILPLVLTHTVIGGASGVGRVALIGIGRFWPWTLSSLAGGLLNVLLVLIFTTVFDWGIHGIIYATIISVTLRCLVWMPWYILRHTKQLAELPKVGSLIDDI